MVYGTGVELCDDGNIIAGDGCGPTCLIEGYDLALKKILTGAAVSGIVYS
jgi:cysteine-rich repeat protein